MEFIPIARASNAAFVASVDQGKATTLSRGWGVGPPAWLPPVRVVAWG